MKFGMKLISHSQTLEDVCTVEVWEWISNFTHTLLDKWLLIYAEIKVKRY